MLTRQWIEEQSKKAWENRRAGIDEVPRPMKMRFDVGETGWGIDIGEDRAIISNVPMTGKVGLLDVVTLVEDENGWPTADRVLFQFFEAKSGIEYAAETDEEAKANYAKIYDALEAAGMRVEGMVSGMALIMHNDDDDIEAVLIEAGMDPDSFSLME